MSCAGWWVPLGTDDPTLGSGSPWQPHPEATPWRQLCPQEADLGLEVRLQAQQAPDLRGSGVDDPGSHKIGRIRIDLFQERGTKPNDLCKGNRKLGHRGCGWTQGHPGSTANKAVTLALVISVSIGCFALKMFCTSCWGLRHKPASDLPPRGHRPSRPSSSHTGAAHLLSCFQR